MGLLVAERKGGFVATFTGKFWPLDPRADEIKIEDIAHHLSMQCRYGGAGRLFYSTAEHSWLLSHAVPKKHALAALLHDGGETYLPDMVRPMKRHFPDYTKAEERIREMIFRKYGLRPEMPPEVIEADDRICADEKAQNLPEIDWNHNPVPLGVTLRFWTPRMAEFEFLTRFYELMRAA